MKVRWMNYEKILINQIGLYILYSLKQKYGKMAVHIYQNRLVATSMKMIQAIVEMHIDFYFPS